MDINQKITEELGVKLWQVEAAVKLIDEGNTIPFIARYRKEATGTLDDEQLRKLYERLVYLRNLEEKKEQVLASIEEQGKLTEELKKQILEAQTQVVVEDLYRPYRPKRRTRATIAKEKGLEPLANTILLQMTKKTLEEEASAYIDQEKEVNTWQEALQGAGDILAETISDDANYRIRIRSLTQKEGKIVTEAKDEKAASVYEMYYQYEEPVTKMAGYRVLAINRGEKEKFLTVKLEAPEDRILGYLRKQIMVRENPQTSEFLEKVIEDSYRRLIAPAVEREIRNALTEQAEDGAIQVFGKNLETLDMKAMSADARRALDNVGMSIDEYTLVAGLPVGYMQFVEIARELDKKNIKLIVLDEPTAVLTEKEAEQFLECVKKVAEKGIAFIFISHKLDEVKRYTHHTFVLRDGEMVGDYDTAELSTIKMSELMVGRKVEILNRDITEESADENQKACLELEHFGVSMPGEVARDITFSVKKGEIFGIGGLAGHGKISIANGIMGLYPSKGSVKIHGKTMNVAKTNDTLNEGIAFVSEDRRGVGLMLDESIELNISIAALKTKNRFITKKFGIPFYDKKGAIEYAKKMIEELDIRCTGYAQPVKSLSGGNQQKVCIARALTLEPDILFVSEPTRGIDIGAKKMILDSLLKLNKEKGVTVIITSSELAELRSVCNRIAIITEGKVAGILRSDEDDYKFGLLMSGSKVEDAKKEAEKE